MGINMVAVAGFAVGASVLILILLIVLMYCYCVTPKAAKIYETVQPRVIQVQSVVNTNNVEDGHVLGGN